MIINTSIVQQRSLRLFSIPAGAPFLESFVHAFLKGEIIEDFPEKDFSGIDPFCLAQTTFYVPTRRSGQALAQTLAQVFRQKAPQSVILLPRIIPLGAFELEGVEDYPSLEGHERETPLGALGLTLPATVSSSERHMVLTRLILHWAHRMIAPSFQQTQGEIPERLQSLMPLSPAQAWKWAQDLAHLMDEINLEECEWDNLKTLIPGDFDTYWTLTLEFLKIATDVWPQHLALTHQIDATERHRHICDRLIERLSRDASQRSSSFAPVIALGSTGTHKATARLLSAILRAPRGAVILPGLDLDLDEKTWKLLDPPEKSQQKPVMSHPQALMARLLNRLRVKREDVREIGSVSPQLRLRMQILSQALRPAETTHHWSQPSQICETPLLQNFAWEGLTWIEAQTEREEALSIALILRESLERKDETTLFITPDRTLVQLVRTDLRRWGIEVEDSSGETLLATSEGALAVLLSEACSFLKTPLALMAFLRHPFVHFQYESDFYAHLLLLLEEAVFHHPLLSGDESLEEIFAHIHAFCTSPPSLSSPAIYAVFTEEDGHELCHFLTYLKDILDSLGAPDRLLPFLTRLQAHQKQIIALLSAPPSEETPLSPACVELLTLFDLLKAQAAYAPAMTAADYSAFFKKILKEHRLPTPSSSGARIKILGLLEARFLQADHMVLGGLNEGLWPVQPTTDSFLNRALRQDLGLTPIERRIGQNAHDFVQACGHERITFTFALKRNGAPQVPSRFLQRLGTVMEETRLLPCRERGKKWLQLARRLSEPQTFSPQPRPEPQPALDLRPLKISVTRFEKLCRDPYAFYAESILKLLPRSKNTHSFRQRQAGLALHALLALFSQTYEERKTLPEHQSWILTQAESAFSALLRDPEWALFHWSRLKKGLQDFVTWDQNRRLTLHTLQVEAYGSYTFPLSPTQNLTLTAIADRIEYHRDGKIALVDFKSAYTPENWAIQAGFACQLSLESALYARGAFPFRAPPAPGSEESVKEALYVALAGAQGLEEQEIGDKKSPLSEWVETQYKDLTAWLVSFYQDNKPYTPRSPGPWSRGENVYDHLSRLKEWSLYES